MGENERRQTSRVLMHLDHYLTILQDAQIDYDGVLENDIPVLQRYTRAREKVTRQLDRTIDYLTVGFPNTLLRIHPQALRTQIAGFAADELANAEWGDLPAINARYQQLFQVAHWMLNQARDHNENNRAFFQTSFVNAAECIEAITSLIREETNYRFARVPRYAFQQNGFLVL